MQECVLTTPPQTEQADMRETYSYLTEASGREFCELFPVGNTPSEGFTAQKLFASTNFL